MQGARGHILRANGKKISWWQAAEVLVMSEGTTRRWKFGYREPRIPSAIRQTEGQPSSRKAPAAEVEQVLGLYRDQYYDLNVLHFHEKLSEEQSMEPIAG